METGNFNIYWETEKTWTYSGREDWERDEAGRLGICPGIPMTLGAWESTDTGETCKEDQETLRTGRRRIKKSVCMR